MVLTVVSLYYIIIGNPLYFKKFTTYTTPNLLLISCTKNRAATINNIISVHGIICRIFSGHININWCVFIGIAIFNNGHVIMNIITTKAGVTLGTTSLPKASLS